MQVGTNFGKIGVPRWCQKKIKIMVMQWSERRRRSGPLKYCSTDNTDSTDNQSEYLLTHPSGRWPGGGYSVIEMHREILELFLTSDQHVLFWGCVVGGVAVMLWHLAVGFKPMNSHGNLDPAP